MRVCTRWRAAWSSREWSRRSGCWTRPPCSCIAWSPTFRRRNRRCWIACITPMKRWSARKVLVVDDDVRNIFALSSVLERRGMTVLTAGTGREAITTLESTPDVAIVLMDIMMPEMDGYETMQVIRREPVVPAAADHCVDGESDERRPRKMPGSGSVGIPGKTRQHRPTALGAANVAPPVTIEMALSQTADGGNEHERQSTS